MLKLKKILMIIGIFTTICALPPVTVASEEFRVNLIATLDNGPAMRSVNWQVLRDGAESHHVDNKHATHVMLSPGKYKVIARLEKDGETIVRTRNFYVNNETSVLVPMDK